MIRFFVITLALIIGHQIDAQTCCSGGVPIASNLGFSSQGKNVLQIAAALEHNQLTTLYNEREVLDDDRRRRTTNSFLARVDYGFTERLNLEILVPYIRQVREVTLNSGESETDGSQGIGDVTILGQLAVVKNQFSNFAIGAGLKLPTGKNDLRNDNGLLLINDLQTGSNTLDYIARFSVARNVTMRPSMSFFANGTAIFRGINDEYLGSEQYKFGNEIQMNIGYSDQVFLWKTLAYPSLSVRFRQARQDIVNRNILENTGGSWIFARAGLGVDIYKGHRISFTAEYPIYTKVDGTQLSPDYILNVAYYKAIDLSPSEF